MVATTLQSTRDDGSFPLSFLLAYGITELRIECDRNEHALDASRASPQGKCGNDYLLAIDN